MKDNELTPDRKKELLKTFMLEQFDFDGLKDAGLFKDVDSEDYEKQAEVICRFLGLGSIYEYGAENVCALVAGDSGKTNIVAATGIYGTPTNSELATIIGESIVIHWDEVPILWAGRNKFGQIVVASACIRWEGPDPDRDIVSVVSERAYCDLIEGRMSYLELIRQAEFVFITTSFANSNKVAVDSVAFDKIPKEWRPLEDSIKNWGNIKDYSI